MTCGSCGKTATTKLNSGLWRCQDCYETFFDVCAWPRVEGEFIKRVPDDFERPWRKWYPTVEQREEWGWR